MSSKFRQFYKVVDDNFTDLKSRTIINSIIQQSKLQATDKPLIEQTYLAELCGCDRRTIHRKLKKLEEDGWLEKKMVLNKQHYTTTQLTIRERLKELMKQTERRPKIKERLKETECRQEKVMKSIIPHIDNTPLRVEDLDL